MKRYCSILLLFLLPSCIFAQIETIYQNSINSNILQLSHPKNIPTYKIPYFDYQKESKRSSNNPNIFAKGSDVSLSLEKGMWTNTNGGRIWSMAVQTGDSYSLTFSFDEIHLPENGYMYITNEDETIIYGPITSKNLPQTDFFLSDVIVGNKAIITLFEPTDKTGESILEISKVYCGFKDFSTINNKQSKSIRGCDNEIACDSNFDIESHGIAYIVYPWNGNLARSTGFLIATTDLSFKPYLQTAFHTIDIDGDNNLSNEERAAIQNGTFKFDYKYSSCEGNDYSKSYTYNGALIRSYYSVTDFALLELSEAVQYNTQLTWLGWDRSSIIPTSGASIHHPLGNPMKISYEYNVFSTGDYMNSGLDNHWVVYFDDGVVKHGSSGSPLLNQDRRVVGQLHGNDQYNYLFDYCAQSRAQYGKFNLSWYGDGTSNSRLSNWLDPIGTGQMITNSCHPISILGSHLISTSMIFSIENLPNGYTVEWNLSDSYYNQHCLQQNYPVPNQCTITRAPYQAMTNATLTANIKYNGVTVRTLTKSGLYAYNDFYGEYTCDTISGIIDYTHVFYVRPGYSTFISSPNLVNATVSYDPAGTTPLYLFLEPTQWRLSFTTPINNNGVPVILDIDDVLGNHYKLYAMPRGSFYFNIAYGDGYINVTLESDDEKALKTKAIEQPWSYEIRSASMGALKASKSINTRSTTISTVGWPKGVYIIKAKIGKEEVTEKIVVK